MKTPQRAKSVSPFWGRALPVEIPRLARMLIRSKLLVAFVAVFALLAGASAGQAGPLSTSETSLIQTIKSHGLAPLRVDVRLARAARGHSATMMRRQFFAHGSVSARARAQGARGPVFGETLAWGTGVTATWVVNQWLASPSHRAVLLRPGFRRLGVGFAFGSFAGHGGAAVVTANYAGR